jgi:hypothetical protein
MPMMSVGRSLKFHTAKMWKALERDAEPSDGGLGAQRLLQRAITERDLASGIYGVVKPCGERRASLSLTAWHN